MKLIFQEKPDYIKVIFSQKKPAEKRIFKPDVPEKLIHTNILVNCSDVMEALRVVDRLKTEGKLEGDLVIQAVQPVGFDGMLVSKEDPTVPFFEEPASEEVEPEGENA